MARIYYIAWYRLDEIDSYLIWFSNDTDGFITEPDSTMPSFRDVEALRVYAKQQQVDLDPLEPLMYDLDTVAHWLNHARVEDIDCDVLLNAWNLFSDVAVSVQAAFDTDRTRTNSIYDKLFWGNNLPAVTPAGKHYTPLWNDDEIKIIEEVLCAGLLLFRTHVRKI